MPSCALCVNVLAGCIEGPAMDFIDLLLFAATVVVVIEITVGTLRRDA